MICPKPTRLSDEFFGTTTEKLAWFATNYNKCRTSYLGDAQ